MKHFLVILAITALVWFGVSIAEVHEYQMPVHVEMTGYDTVRYAVVRADTLVPMHLTMSGFNAAAIDLFGISRSVTVDMSNEGLTRAVAMDEVCDNVRQQLASIGVRRASSLHDSLRLFLAERQHRTVPVRLDSVRFSFSEQYGLYGQPRITPQTVTLYGADAVLANITEVQVAPTEVVGISATTTCHLALDPVWERVGDVRASVTEVDVFLPVEAYVEREYDVPISVDGADSSVRLRLYPDVAHVRVWVAQRDLERMPDFRVAISYDDMIGGSERLAPRLVMFPSWIRPRSVEPSNVQCVIIK